jgi:AcrR family transcriptional regulator
VEPPSTRERIVDAAVDCLVRLGWEKTTISEVAGQAGVSRPTVYAHFRSKDDLFVEVAGRAAQRISERVVAAAEATATSGAEFVVETVVTTLREYRGDPSASLVGLVRPGQALAAESVEVVRSLLAPLVRWEPQLADDLDEVAETVMRFVVSLMVDDGSRHRTDADLRSYLHRRLVPALHIKP